MGAEMVCSIRMSWPPIPMSTPQDEGLGQNIVEKASCYGRNKMLGGKMMVHETPVVTEMSRTSRHSVSPGLMGLS